MDKITVPVAQQGLTIGGAGIWTLVALVVIAMVKVWPIILEQGLKAKAALRGERRDEIKALRDTVTQMQQDMAKLMADTLAANARVMQFEFALQLATDEIEARIPDSTVPQRIRRMLSAGVPNSRPSGVTQHEMDMLRGVE